MIPMAKPSPSYSKTTELVALGHTIKGLRLDLGLSQEALAFEAGIDRSYIGGIERGEHNLALINLIKIAQTLGITLSELFSKAKL
jgi:transcriptional regulator with XRE-family HTH domain